MARRERTRAPRSGRSIRQLLTMLPLLLVPVLAVQAASYYGQFRSRRARELAGDLEMARGIAKSLQLTLQQITHDEMAIGHVFVVPPSPPPQLWPAVLRRYARDFPSVASFAWVDTGGRVVAASDAGARKEVSEEGWFRAIAAGADWAVTDAGRAGPGEGFQVAQSVRDGHGVLRGIVVATVLPADLGRELDISSGEGRTVSIVDHTGWLVFQAPPRPRDVQERNWLQRYPVLTEVLRGESRTGSGVDPRLRERHLYALAPVPGIGWAVAVAEPEAQVTGPILAGLARDGVLVLGVALIAFLVAMMTVRRIAGPIERLRDYALAIGRGEYPTSVAVGGPEELESLSQTFDRMARQVQQREHEHRQLLESERGRARDAALLAAIQEAISNPLVYLDAELRIVRANPAAQAALGRDQTELIGHAAEEVLAGAPNILSLLRQAQQRKEEVRVTDYRHSLSRHPELGERFFDISITPVTGSEGSFEGLVVVAVDLTERVQQREQLLAAERARAELAETLNAETSHRVKNHLMMAAAMLQLQMGQEEDPRTKAALGDAGARLLTFAAIHEQLQASPGGGVDLLAAVQRLARAARDAFAVPGAELTVEGASVELPSRAAVNLALAANELVTNAAKHGAPGASGKLGLKVRLAREEGAILLSVWNSGNPVPEGFDPSRQRGMGLQLVTALVEQCQGSFTLRPCDGGSLAEVRIAEEKLPA